MPDNVACQFAVIVLVPWHTLARYKSSNSEKPGWLILLAKKQTRHENHELWGNRWNHKINKLSFDETNIVYFLTSLSSFD